MGWPLVGAGRTDLVHALFGIAPLRSGSLQMEGRRVAIRSPEDALAAGIALVPEDRKRDGLIMTGSAGFNLALAWVQCWIRGCWPDWRRRAAVVGRAIESFSIKLSTPEQSVTSLSGGNQQKVVVGKWMERPPKVLILDEPTRGVDVGAREEMFAILCHLVEPDRHRRFAVRPSGSAA